MKNTTILAAGIIITGLSAASITACGGDLPSAASVLTSDGCTQISTSALTGDMHALPADDVSSSAVGVSTSNSSELLMVFVLTSQGVNQVSSGLPAVQNEAKSAGFAMSLNGNVLTMTGTEQQFNALQS